MSLSVYLAGTSVDFLQSVIADYSLSANARYMHEYHTYLLDNAVTSFEKLESFLKTSGFSCAHRLIICGYQKDAMPSYSSESIFKAIDDEYAVLTSAGWDFASGNVFGFIAGFLLRGVNGIRQSYESLFEHIAPDSVDLFDARAHLFCQHAFADAYPSIGKMQKGINRSVSAGAYRSVLAGIDALWGHLYESKIEDGAHAIIATPDSLFARAYAQHIVRSDIVVNKFFIGPDITYPIEYIACQDLTVTQAAQQFVQRIVEQLQPIDGKKTAYLFCSLVDGVGKSTLLGNICNFQSYGSDFLRYERVDNSSSQRAELYHLSDQVCIVDLPAQVSHLLLKPCGFVCVDIDTVTEISADQQSNIYSFFSDNYQQIVSDFFARVNQVACASCMWDNADTYDIAYIKNCLILDVLDTCWVSFLYQGWFCVGDRKTKKIRIVQPLSRVHSRGLKVVESEQMIFSDGVSVPMQYTAFLNDLARMLRDAQVQEIVLVDFMSMYPRSSRETIRLNFTLQQLKVLYGHLFVREQSLYQHFVSQYDLYLLYRDYPDGVRTTVLLDSIVRTAAHMLLNTYQNDQVVQVPTDQVVSNMRQMCTQIMREYGDMADRAITQKVSGEYRRCAQRSLLSKECNAIAQFSFDDLCSFAENLQDFCSRFAVCTTCREHWRALESPIREMVNEKTAILENNMIVEVVGVYASHYHDPVYMRQCIPMIRAHWYDAVLSIIIRACGGENGSTSSDKKQSGLVPIMVKRISDSQVCIVRSTVHDGCQLQKIDIRRTGLCVCGHNTCDLFVCPVRYAIEQCRVHYHANASQFIPTSYVWQKYKQLFPVKKNVCTARIDKTRTLLQTAVLLLATIELIIPNPDAGSMIRKESQNDFCAAVQLLECSLRTNCGLGGYPEWLFSDYSDLFPVIAA